LGSSLPFIKESSFIGLGEPSGYIQLLPRLIILIFGLLI